MIQAEWVVQRAHDERKIGDLGAWIPAKAGMTKWALPSQLRSTFMMEFRKKKKGPPLSADPICCGAGLLAG